MKSEPDVPGKDEALLALLGKLALHYWRPDFTPAQAKQLYRDYVEDLRQFALADIAEAIAEYRQDGKNRFYPTSGQLIDLIIGKAKFEAENPGAPDRAKTLARSRSHAISRGRQEMHEMRARLSGQPLPALPAPEYVPPQPPSKPLATDLPDHPCLGEKQPPADRPLSEIVASLPRDNWYARAKLPDQRGE